MLTRQHTEKTLQGSLFGYIQAPCAVVVPEDVRLAERPVEDAEVDWHLMGCSRKDLTTGCVPLLPLL